MKLLTKTQTITETTVRNVVFCCRSMELSAVNVDYKGAALNIAGRFTLINSCPWCGERVTMEEQT